MILYKVKSTVASHAGVFRGARFSSLPKAKPAAAT